MMEKLLQDILDDVISTEIIIQWLSNYDENNQVDCSISQYECNQFDFICYFLGYLREQSSKIFQCSSAAQTPSKKQSSNVKNFSATHDIKPQLKKTPDLKTNSFDIGSTQLFPSLPNSVKNETPESTNKSRESQSAKRVGRRVKLFPDQSQSSTPKNESMDRESQGFSTPKFSPIAGELGSSSDKIMPSTSRQNHSADETRKIESGFSRNRSFGSEKSASRASLGDFIIERKEKKPKARRRINPIRIGEMQDGGDKMFVSQEPEIPAVEADVRLLQRMECVSLTEQLNVSLTEQLNVSNSPHSSDVAQAQNNTPSESLHPSPTLVTPHPHFLPLSHFYSSVLSHHLPPNPQAEFFFLFSLLTVPLTNNSKCKSGQGILDSVHNGVYFAVTVLWLVRHELCLLSGVVLRLLVDNTRVELFCPQLRSFLLSELEQREAKGTLAELSLSRAQMQGNVSFSCENDNRDNFSTEQHFHSFKRQRDAFYTLLSQWESHTHSTQPGDMASKVKAIFALSSDPCNLVHFARLFRSQLVTSCCADAEIEDEGGEDLLHLLPSIDPSKLSRLRARLVSRPRLPASSPTHFPGRQEFFKSFISHSAHSAFTRFLRDSLCDEILRLNDTDFDEDSQTDTQTQSSYLDCVMTLRLLAKFLSFLEFQPYRGSSPLVGQVLQVHCSVREKLLPPFDLLQALQTAATTHRLLLTLPWILSFLSLSDSASPHLPSYLPSYRFLTHLYHSLPSLPSHPSAFYLALHLGWFFRLPHFPSHLLSQSGHLPGLCSSGLDGSDVITESVINSVCSFLEDLRIVLSESSGGVKHIRPITMQPVSSRGPEQARQLELRLEESFLHNQSSSTRKAVEFTTERVTSCAIKRLARDVIPAVKKAALTELAEVSKTLTSEKAVTEAADSAAVRCHDAVIAACESSLASECPERCKMALEALLGADVPCDARRVCLQVAARQAMDKGRSWLKNHLTIDIIKSDFFLESRRFNLPPTPLSLTSPSLPQTSLSLEPLSSLPQATLSLEPLSSLPQASLSLEPLSSLPQAFLSLEPPSSLLVSLRNLLYSLHSAPTTTTTHEMTCITQQVTNCLAGKQDIASCVEPAIRALLLEVIISVCIYCSLQIAIHTLSNFLSFLLPPPSPSPRIVCPRTILMILSCPSPSLAWSNLAFALQSFLSRGVLSSDEVAAQLVSFTRQNWSKSETLQYMQFVEHFQRLHSSSGMNKLNGVLETLLETLRGFIQPEQS